MDKIVVFGTGDFARLAHFYLTNDSTYEVTAFTTDKEFIPEEKTFCGLPVLPFERITESFPPKEFKMFVAVAYSQCNKVRSRKYFEAKDKGYELITYISSRTKTWPDIVVGDNCFIVDDQSIQPFVEIGNNVIILGNNNVINHDSFIGDHCYISTNVVICGRVKIGPYCFLGANSTIRDKVVIAKGCVIGAGATILKDTIEKGVYIGTEARLYNNDSSSLENI